MIHVLKYWVLLIGLAGLTQLVSSFAGGYAASPERIAHEEAD